MATSPVPGSGSAATRTTAPNTNAATNALRVTIQNLHSGSEPDQQFPGVVNCELRVVNWLSVYVPIPVFFAATRVHIELLAHTVDLPFQVPISDLGERIDAKSLQVGVTNDEAAEVCGVGDASGLRERCVKRDCPHDQHENLCRNRKHEPHVDRSIWKVQGIGQQQAVNRA